MDAVPVLHALLTRRPVAAAAATLSDLGRSSDADGPRPGSFPTGRSSRTCSAARSRGSITGTLIDVPPGSRYNSITSITGFRVNGSLQLLDTVMPTVDPARRARQWASKGRLSAPPAAIRSIRAPLPFRARAALRARQAADRGCQRCRGPWTGAGCGCEVEHRRAFVRDLTLERRALGEKTGDLPDDERPRKVLRLEPRVPRGGHLMRNN